MSAVPSSSQLAVVLPAAATTVTQAELAEDTHKGIANVNSLLDQVLGLVDAVRSYEPTSRTSNSRTWGPFADSKNRGWQWRLVVTREPDGTTFDYHLDVQNTAAGTPTWVEFFNGSFDLAGGVKQGNGSVSADFGALVAAKFPLEDDTSQLATLTIDYRNYRTAGSPVSVTLKILRASPDPDTGVTSIEFRYEILADGSGEIGFTLVGNVIPGPAIETLALNAQWMATGAGKATLAVQSGDGAGMTQTECWDATFEATYNDKPWSATEDLGLPSLCSTLPDLSTMIQSGYVGLDPRCDVVVPYGLTHRGRRTILAEHFRRIDPRYERQLEVEVSYDGKKQTSQTRNISLGGLYLDSLTSLPIGTTVQLRFTLPTQPEPVEVAGDVRWVVKKGTSDASGIGIRFQGLRAKDVWALNRFFQSAT